MGCPGCCCCHGFGEVGGPRAVLIGWAGVARAVGGAEKLVGPTLASRWGVRFGSVSAGQARAVQWNAYGCDGQKMHTPDY